MTINLKDDNGKFLGNTKSLYFQLCTRYEHNLKIWRDKVNKRPLSGSNTCPK
uniref:Uncharacterized protein n=1 Tax=Tetranychus urticae TaxID=32264 RepID=T1L2E0_TETUR